MSHGLSFLNSIYLYVIQLIEQVQKTPSINNLKFGISIDFVQATTMLYVLMNSAFPKLPKNLFF